MDFTSLNIPLTQNEALALLATKGFQQVKVDVVALAKACIGLSKYRRGARLCEAPDVVDCSSLIKWLYGQRGIWLPRRSIQQREYGEPVLEKIIAGDVLFVSGFIDYYLNDPDDGVGHVGIATGEGTIIHAANERLGVVESPIEGFIDNTEARGVRRYLPLNKEIITLEVPPHREIEFEDDIRWIILQSI